MTGSVLLFVPSCFPISAIPWTPVAKKTKIGINAVFFQTSKTICVWVGSQEITGPGN
jgi:hypothetical protein